jgi:N-acetylglucosamine-6-phosphate deacetylase
VSGIVHAGSGEGARRLGVSRAIVDGRIVDGDVEIADGAVSRVGLSPAGTGLALPGLIDLQVNGYAGVDVGGADVEAMHQLGRARARDGVLAYGPTIMTSPPEDVVRGLRTVVETQRSTPPDAARIVGAHVEGPFLSPRRAGIHPPELLRHPDPALVETFLSARPITMFTLAPELPGALALIAQLAARGVLVSLGHSDATVAEARAGIDAGARAATHTWNGMRPLGHRDPGIVGAVLTDPRVHIGLIGDGVHIAREVLRLTWGTARGRICLVTDAVAAAGAPDGRYRIGPVVIERRDGRVHDLEGRVGGGATTLLASVRLAVEDGTDLLDAVGAVTIVPARLMQRPDLGALRPGARADLVVVTDGLELGRVLLAGREVANAA